MFNWYSEQYEDKQEIESLTNKDFNDYFNERLSEAAEHNSSNNIQRGNYLHSTTKSVVVSFLCIALTAPFYVINNVKNNNDINKVTIVNHQQLKSENIIMTTKPLSKESNTQSEKPVSAKPTGPQNVVFKDNSGSGSKTNNNTKK